MQTLVWGRALPSSAPGSNCFCIATSAAVAEDAAELYGVYLNNETRGNSSSVTMYVLFILKICVLVVTLIVRV